MFLVVLRRFLLRIYILSIKQQMLLKYILKSFMPIYLIADILVFFILRHFIS